MAQSIITRAARITERFHARELQQYIKQIEATKLKRFYSSFGFAKV